ncbi:MAG: hypothetical protein RL150_79 [Candidatus Parcubacteria bacterium]|jgi:hypothetical protein
MKKTNPNPFRVHYDYDGLAGLLDTCAVYNSGRMFTLRYEARGKNRNLTINGFTLVEQVESSEHTGILNVDAYGAFYGGLPPMFRPLLSVSRDSEGRHVFSCDAACGDESLHLLSGFYTEELHEALVQTRRVPNPANLFAGGVVPELFELSSCA